MDFGLMFFSAFDAGARAGKYQLVLDAARFADTHGFCGIWLPERHFHAFGGLFPNPAVAAAAVAQVTTRLQLRAGSVIPPLHDALRIVEEWAMVDNLSGGRVALSFGSGWNPDDFVLHPDRYEARRAIMHTQIEAVLHLWQGGTIARTNPFGRTLDVRTFPQPVQARPEIWITAGGARETCVRAGQYGAHLLTSLEKGLLREGGLPRLAENIAAYRQALAAAGFAPERGKVALMLHTLLGDDVERLRTVAGPAMRRYLMSAVDLQLKMARASETAEMQAADDTAVSAPCASSASSAAPATPAAPVALADADLQLLVDVAFDKYFDAASLIGTPEQRLPLIRQLEALGVNEIACLVDFVDSPALILDSLTHLDRLRSMAAA